VIRPRARDVQLLIVVYQFMLVRVKRG